MQPYLVAKSPNHHDAVTLYAGDCLRVLKTIPAQSVETIVCDPPYAIRAISNYLEPHRTDSRIRSDQCAICGNPHPENGFTACRTCLADIEIDAFSAAGMLGQQSANWHEKATHSRGYADNDNRVFGRWVLLWARECHRALKPGGHLVAFGGTRTWHRLASGIEDAGFDLRDSLAWLYATGYPKAQDLGSQVDRLIKTSQPLETTHRTEPGAWNGWATVLKPAHEPIVLARKPLTGTVAANVLRHGTGALNINATRLEDGRWPSNVFLDHPQAGTLDDIAGDLASRFFWVAKPGPTERVTVNGVKHPTVKPLELIRELVRLVAPPDGTVLDPFAGSGTTAEACLLEQRRCILIERELDYLPLIEARIERGLQRRHPDVIPTAADRGLRSEPALFDLP